VKSLLGAPAPSRSDDYLTRLLESTLGQPEEALSQSIHSIDWHSTVVTPLRARTERGHRLLLVNGSAGSDGVASAGQCPSFGREGQRARPAWPGCGLRVLSPPARTPLPPSPAPPSVVGERVQSCCQRTSGDAALYVPADDPSTSDSPFRVPGTAGLPIRNMTYGQDLWARPHHRPRTLGKPFRIGPRVRCR